MASIQDWIVEYVSIDEQARDVGVDAADSLQELFDVLTRVQSKAQPCT